VLKSVLGLASNGLAFWISVKKTVLKCADLSITVSGKNVAQGLYWWYNSISFMGVIQWGSVKTERQIGELYSQLLFNDHT